ncbi:hypothetical protein BD779DRAFT_1504780 [Infundibulicybe gibba]|nr:hypothetical protein BD779DRAFT_1504780 [Infundibulicybe gibba]
MNISGSLRDISSQLFQTPPSSIPSRIWEFYSQNLWYYGPNSWVARAAYSCRILAIVVVLPIMILGLLDITSYGIARTLGVIDDVKASTSDKETVHQDTPTILVHEPKHDAQKDPQTSPPAFFVSEDNNLKLSGVGVFSPATSQPPSPTISRRTLAHTDLDDGSLIRQRLRQVSEKEEST